MAALLIVSIIILAKVGFSTLSIRKYQAVAIYIYSGL